MTNDDLRKNLIEASRIAIRAVADAHGGEHLNGFALCTDDDLQTVYPVASTEEACRRSKEEDVRYIPVDWEYDEGATAFDEVNAELARRALAARDHAAHVHGTFQCMVSALEELKQSDAFAADFLWIVTSTDPSVLLEKMSDEAVRRLNSDEVYEDWVAAMY